MNSNAESETASVKFIYPPLLQVDMMGKGTKYQPHSLYRCRHIVVPACQETYAILSEFLFWSSGDMRHKTVVWGVAIICLGHSETKKKILPLGLGRPYVIIYPNAMEIQCSRM